MHYNFYFNCCKISLENSSNHIFQICKVSLYILLEISDYDGLIESLSWDSKNRITVITAIFQLKVVNFTKITKLDYQE